jgi:hypothetical protein
MQRLPGLRKTNRISPYIQQHLNMYALAASAAGVSMLSAHISLSDSVHPFAFSSPQGLCYPSNESQSYMSETSFNIKGNGVGRVRLEATDVAGIGSPANPQLALNVKFQLLPLELHAPPSKREDLRRERELPCRDGRASACRRRLDAECL